MVDKEAERRARNREKVRLWKEKNPERWAAIRQKSRARSASNYVLTSTKQYVPSKVALCSSCCRLYLEKLGCLFCT